MSDDITVPGRGAVLATDEIDSIHWPLTKLVFGEENVATLVSEADPVPATIAEIGTAVASPAANTVLGRLKAIADGITTLAGHVDGLEGLATALNGFVDGIETLQGTTNTTLTTLNGFVDGLEALLGGVATQTTLAAIAAQLPASLGAKANGASLSIVPSTSASFTTKPDGVDDGAETLGWDGTGVSMTGYGYAVIEVTAMGSATAITVNDGISGANAIQVFRRSDNSLINTITAAGLYRASASGTISLTGIGTAAVNLKRKRA
jgi:hypothetical protein